MFPILVGGLEPWNLMTFHMLGISSSQLTNSIIFQRVGQPPAPDDGWFPPGNPLGCCDFRVM